MKSIYTERARDYAHKEVQLLKETDWLNPIVEDRLMQTYLQACFERVVEYKQIFKDLRHRIQVDKVSTEEILLFIEDQIEK